MASHPVSKQPGHSGSAGELYPYTNEWQNTLFGSFKPCPRSAFACFCSPCFTAKLSERVGEHMLTCCVNPSTMMSIRTKVRTAYKIKGTLMEDCYTTSCCVGACAAMQIEHELNHRGIPEKRAK